MRSNTIGSTPNFRAIVQARSEHNAYTNSFRFMLEDAVWDMQGVQDVTKPVRIAAKELL